MTNTGEGRSALQAAEDAARSAMWRAVAEVGAVEAYVDEGKTPPSGFLLEKQQKGAQLTKAYRAAIAANVEATSRARIEVLEAALRELDRHWEDSTPAEHGCDYEKAVVRAVLTKEGD